MTILDKMVAHVQANNDMDQEARDRYIKHLEDYVWCYGEGDQVSTNMPRDLDRAWAYAVLSPIDRRILQYVREHTWACREHDPRENGPCLLDPVELANFWGIPRGSIRKATRSLLEDGLLNWHEEIHYTLGLNVYKWSVRRITEWDVLAAIYEVPFGPGEPRRRAKQKIPQSLRTAVFERDAYRCRHCGGYESLAADHIVAEASGGTTTLDNLQTLCGRCNSRKGTKVIRVVSMMEGGDDVR